MKKERNFLIVLSSLIFIIFVQLATIIFEVPEYIIPAPSDVIVAFFSNLDNLLIHGIYTMIETMLGLFFSIIIGIIISIIYKEFNIVKKISFHYIVIMQTIPLVALAPLFINWFGVGLFSKVFLITIICCFPIINNLTNSLYNINEDKLMYFKTLKPTKIQMYKYLYIPETLESLFSGIKISITYSMITAVFAEYIGAKCGLGLYLNIASSSFQTDVVFAIIIVISMGTLMLLKVNDIVFKKIRS